MLLDQFSRNCHRHTPRAFAGDARAFAYMPFEHDEAAESQRESLRLFGTLREETGLASFHDYALKHADVIRRFGRYPHRNRILGRASSPEEEAWLAAHGGF